MADKRIPALAGTITQGNVVGTDFTSYSSATTDYKITWSTIADYVMGSRTWGGNGQGDPLTTDGTQTTINKTINASRINSPKINEDVTLLATSTDLNKLDGLATTAEELGYVAGATSNLQTQINGKANASLLDTVMRVFRKSFHIGTPSADYTLTAATILTGISQSAGFIIVPCCICQIYEKISDTRYELLDSTNTDYTIQQNVDTNGAAQVYLDNIQFSNLAESTSYMVVLTVSLTPDLST